MSIVTKDKKVSDITIGELQEIVRNIVKKELNDIIEDSYWGVKANRSVKKGFIGYKKSEDLLKDLVNAED